MKNWIIIGIISSFSMTMKPCGTCPADTDDGKDDDGKDDDGKDDDGKDDDGKDDDGKECMQFASTHEGCQIGGPKPGVCPAKPKGWSGTATPGEACASGTDCAGIVCECEKPMLQWYVGVCACGRCADYDVACDVANVVSCLKIEQQ